MLLLANRSRAPILLSIVGLSLSLSLARAPLRLRGSNWKKFCPSFFPFFLIVFFLYFNLASQGLVFMKRKKNKEREEGKSRSDLRWLGAQASNLWGLDGPVVRFNLTGVRLLLFLHPTKQKLFFFIFFFFSFFLRVWWCSSYFFLPVYSYTTFPTQNHSFFAHFQQVVGIDFDD